MGVEPSRSPLVTPSDSDSATIFSHAGANGKTRTSQLLSEDQSIIDRTNSKTPVPPSSGAPDLCKTAADLGESSAMSGIADATPTSHHQLQLSMDETRPSPADPVALNPFIEADGTITGLQDVDMKESAAAAVSEFNASIFAIRESDDTPGDIALQNSPRVQLVPARKVPQVPQVEPSPSGLSTGTSPKTTPVIRPYRTLQPKDTVDLVNTIQTIFEDDPQVRDNGVVLLDAPHLIPAPGEIRLPPSDYLFEATSQRVMTPSKLRGIGLVVIKSEKAELKEQVPKFNPVKNLTHDEMEGVFQRHIISHIEGSTRHPYFNIDISDFACRPKGSFELTCGSPMDKLSYIAGVNTPYGYYSKAISHFGAHVEDWRFASYNIVFAGATKLWIAVKPSSQELFEEKIREIFPTSGTCVQFIRHLAINIAPSTLRQWGVEHFFVPQNPGQVVAVSGFTYHWGINTGHNYAEAINFCMDKNWKAPEDFKNCYHGCGIADDMIPLPKPVQEEGDMEEKKQRAIERDAAFRASWSKETESQISKQQKRMPKPKDRKQRESTGRAQSDALRVTPIRPDAQPRPRSDPAVLVSQPRKSTVSQQSVLPSLTTTPMLDAIKVTAHPRRLGNRPRQFDRQPTYRDSSSNLSEAEDTDNEPSFIKAKLSRRSNHSRHASGEHRMPAQLDTDALSSQISQAIRSTFLPFLLDEKKARAKHEDLQRLQLDWQVKQVEYTRKILESQQRTEHLTMMMHQALENSNKEQAPTLSGVIPHKPSNDGSSQPTHQRVVCPPQQNKMLFHQTRDALVTTSAASGSSQVHSERGVIPVTKQLLEEAAKRSSLRRQHEQSLQTQPAVQRTLLDSTTTQSLLAALSGRSIASASEATSTERSGSTGVSADVTDDDTRTSPEFSPITPQNKSLQSTPLVDAPSPSSNLSSLSEQEVNDDTKIVHEKVIDVREMHSDNLTREPAAADLEHGMKSGQALASESQSGTIFTPIVPSVGRPNVGGNPHTCAQCAKRGLQCDKKSTRCANCIKSHVKCIYTGQSPPVSASSGRSTKKRTVGEVESMFTSSSIKRVKTASIPAAGETSKPIETAKPSASTAQLIGEENHRHIGVRAERVSRDMTNLFASKEWKGH